MQTKSELRQAMLARRKRLTAAEMAEAGALAGGLLLPLLATRRNVMLYAPFRGELDTWPLARLLEAAGCGVVLPITDRATRRLTPALVQGVNSLVAGAYGILEPAAGAYAELDPLELDAVVVPGACFDLHGYRIGYGGGYYDRFIPRLRSDCLTIGFGYDWQVVDCLAHDPWDQSLSHLATEKRIVEIANSKQ